MTLLFLLSTSFAITFLAMLINTTSAQFMMDCYWQVIVACLFVFAIFIGIAYTTASSSRAKSLIWRDVTISISIVSISVLVSVAFKVYLHNMALVLILPAMLIAILLGKKVAKYVNVMTSIVYIILLLLESLVKGTPFGIDSIISVLFSLLSGILMITLVDKNYTRYKMVIGSLFYAILIAIAVMPASLLYTFEPREIIFNAIWLCAGQVIAIAMYSLLLPLYERLFEVCTDFKLAELASFSSPLLIKLREEAPGTFNHSLVVGNLAESCAIAVGEDPFLARAAAYYHDVGKLKNPKMFIENQDGKYNPHDELIPEVSARMITRHAKAGYEMLKEYHMPEEIARVAIEHHGTSPVMFFYLKAQKITEGKLSMNKYKYDGPRPTTKVSAIIMICDTVEAAVRSRQPKTEEELREFVKKMIKDKMDLEQFDDCDITFNDLKIIEDEIVKTIPSIFHHRIDYRQAKK